MLGFILIASESRYQMGLLERLILSGVPAEIELTPIPSDSVFSLLHWIPDCPKGGIVEVRRRSEELVPIAGLKSSNLESGFVDEWCADAVDIRRVFRILAGSKTRTLFVIHISGVDDIAGYLDDVSNLYSEAQAYLSSQDIDCFKWLEHVSSTCEFRLRGLRQGALRVRVLVQGEERLDGPLLNTIGISYTRDSSYDLVRPSDAVQHYDALRLFTELRSADWAYGNDSNAAVSNQITTVKSAANLMQFPTASKAGLEGFQSRPISSLPRSPQSTGDNSGSIDIGWSPEGNIVSITRRELNQHLLVAGLPGFGKTNSVHMILRSLWNIYGVPFLVIDPAKRDYGVLLKSLKIVNGLKPRRVQLSPDFPAFNPLGVPSGCSWRSHAGRVVGAFDSALRVSESYPMGFIILSRAIFSIYNNGDNLSPTLKDLLDSINQIIEAEVKDPKTKSNVKASLLGRILFLVNGPMGKAFSEVGSINWKELLDTAVVVELKGFTGPTERSLVFGLLIAGLASFREATAVVSSSLLHVTVLEEAHRVLTNRSSSESEGVRLLSEAIAELRGSGEGFIVVDQAPTSINPVVRKVCGSALVHRLVDVEERNIMGSALLLDGRQSEDLARLNTGQAVYYGASRNGSVVVNVGKVEVGKASFIESNNLTMFG